MTFFWKAYLPIGNTLNGKRPRIGSAPASTPPLPDRQHWFLVCPTLNPLEQRKTRRGRPQGTEQYGMVKQYGETVSLKQGCSVVRPATLDLGSGVSPAIVLAPGCRQRRSLSAPGCRTDSHDTPPSHSAGGRGGAEKSRLTAVPRSRSRIVDSPLSRTFLSVLTLSPSHSAPPPALQSRTHLPQSLLHSH